MTARTYIPSTGLLTGMLALMAVCTLLLNSCGGSSPNQAGPSSGVLSVSAPERAVAGSPVRLGLSNSPDLVRVCRECRTLEFPLVTSTGDELGRLSPGESLQASFNSPGLWVVMPESSPELERPITNGLQDARVVAVGESGEFELEPSRIILRSVAETDEGQIEALLDLHNGLVETPDGERHGFVDPAFHEVRLNVVALDEQGERVYSGNAVTVEVETTRPLLVRHEPPEVVEFDSLVLNVGATRLVPDSRLFIKPKSINLPLD